MQLDFTREELLDLLELIRANHVTEDLGMKIRRAAWVSKQVFGAFHWRTDDGARQINNALVLLDGKPMVNVAVADTDAGLVALFDNSVIEGRVEVWVP